MISVLSGSYPLATFSCFSKMLGDVCGNRATASMFSAVVSSLRCLLGLFFSHETTADRQPRAESDRSSLHLRCGGEGRRADPVLYPATRCGREGSEGWGDEEGGRGEDFVPRAGSGGRGEGGEHPGGYREARGCRRADLRRGAGDRGGRDWNVEGAG